MDKNVVHSFSVCVATELGQGKAVLLYNLEYWIRHNEANAKNFFDGFYWTFNSSKAFAKLFPYLREKTIAMYLKELEDDGYIVSSKEYNKVAFDRTKWYRLTEKYHQLFDLPISENQKSNAENQKSNAENQKSNAENQKSYTDINTDRKPDINPNTTGGEFCEKPMEVVERTNDEYEKILAYFNHAVPQSEDAQASLRKCIRDLGMVFKGWDFPTLEAYVFAQFQAYRDLKNISAVGKHHTANNFVYALKEQNFEGMLKDAEMQDANVENERLCKYRDEYLFKLFDIGEAQTESRKAVNRMLAEVERTNRVDLFINQSWAYYRLVVGFRESTTGFVFVGQGKKYRKDLPAYINGYWNIHDWQEKLKTEVQKQKSKSV